MKKILLAIALVLMVGFGLNAQMDSFFNSNAEDYSSSSRTGTLPIMPQGGIGTSNNDQSATVPLGEGLLVLTAFGACYAAARKKDFN